MSAILIAVPAVLLFMGTPVFLVFLTASVFALMFVVSTPAIALHQTLFASLDSYALLAIPFFVFAGELMDRGGIASRIVTWVLTMTGRIPGSLGVATVGASTMMGAISGSSVAAVAALSKNLYPRLRDAGYGTERSVGLVAAAGAIDIVIPPSIAMILFAMASEQSIARLFVAGILPGILIAVLMASFIAVIAAVREIPTHGNVDGYTVLVASREALWALLMPVFVIGGIYNGWFSPTEAGGFASLYAMLVSRFVFRSMSWMDVVDAAADAALTSAKIMMIVASAGVITWLLTTQGVPQAIAGFITEMDLSVVAFLLLVNIILLLAGCVLDPTSAILVLAPLLVPIAISIGVDPVHFGVIMTVNLAIGMFTPPFGLNLFVAQEVTGLSTRTVYLGVLPFVVVQIIGLALITYVPAISLILGNAM